jgi:hypothetical protein
VNNKNELTTTTTNAHEPTMILTLTDDNADTNIQEFIDNNQHADKTNRSYSLMLTTISAPRLTIINRMTPSKHTYQVILKTLARLASIDDYADIVYISDYDDLLLEANEFDGCGLNAGGIASRSNTIILNTNPSNTMMIDRIARIVSMIHNTCTGTHVLLNIISNMSNLNTIQQYDNTESINIKRSLAWIHADGFTNIELTAFTENNSFTGAC